MSKTKIIIALIALIVFVFGMTAVSNAVAGEKHKLRIVGNVTKWEQIEVGDQEGHVIALFDKQGIYHNLEGKPFCNGWFAREMGLLDLNVKTGVFASCDGYDEITDADGDKFYIAFKGKSDKKGKLKGEMKVVKGTGKFEGIRGKGTWVFYPVTATWGYTDCAWEVELP